MGNTAERRQLQEEACKFIYELLGSPRSCPHKVDMTLNGMGETLRIELQCRLPPWSAAEPRRTQMRDRHAEPSLHRL